MYVGPTCCKARPKSDPRKVGAFDNNKMGLDSIQKILILHIQEKKKKKFNEFNICYIGNLYDLMFSPSDRMTLL